MFASTYVYPRAKDTTATPPNSFKTSNLGTDSNISTPTESSFWLAALSIRCKPYRGFSSFSSATYCCAQRLLYPNKPLQTLLRRATFLLHRGGTLSASRPADWPLTRVKGWTCPSSFHIDNRVSPDVSSETNCQGSTSSVRLCNSQKALPFC